MPLSRAAFALALAGNPITGGVETVLPAEERIPRSASAIVNGLLTEGFPSVAMLVNTSVCTGTLIGCNTILAAAHCFCRDVPASDCDPDLDTEVFFQHVGVVTATSIAIHPDWQGATGDPHDLAIVRFLPALPISPIRTNDFGTVPLGADGLVAGFGVTDGILKAGLGIKRYGRVRTAPCALSAPVASICWDFDSPVGAPGTDSNTCGGDSGGPLFLVDGLGQPLLAGVTSYGNSTCLPPDNSVDVDVFAHRQWITSTALGDVGVRACSFLSDAGTAGAPIFSTNGHLASPTSTHLRTFEVAPDTALLAVVLNAESGSTDFDLAVFSPSATTPTCVSQRPLSFLESCLISAPRAGRWTASVGRVAGAGEYQLTTTHYTRRSSSGDESPVCVAGPTSLCLAADRFRVSVDFFNLPGNRRQGRATKLTSDTGYFWFFDPDNVEVVVKVLEACSINGNFWIFAGGLTDLELVLRVEDTVTGEAREYVNAAGEPFRPVRSTTSFPNCPESATTPTETAFPHSWEGMSVSFVDSLPSGPYVLRAEGASSSEVSTCSTTDSKLCVAQNRFEIEVDYVTQRSSGIARAVKLTNDTGYFWFFNEANVELVVKVLNGCALNGRYWVFAGGLTDTETTLRVRDTMTGATQSYLNSLGVPFEPIQDTGAFACP